MNILNCYGVAISVALVILGVVLGWGLSHFSAKKLAHDHAKREAGRRLRAAFSNVRFRIKSELRTLQQRRPELQETLRECDMLSISFYAVDYMLKQDDAVLEFSYYLPAEEKDTLIKAWEKYCTSIEHIVSHLWGTSNEYRMSMINTVENDINDILAFTEEKKRKNTFVRLWHFCKKFTRST